MRPHTAPTKTPRIRATGTGRFRYVMAMQAMPPVRPTMEPAERSMPSMMMAKLMPMARSIYTDALSRICVKFAMLLKLGVMMNRMIIDAAKIPMGPSPDNFF